MVLGDVGSSRGEKIRVAKTTNQTLRFIAATPTLFCLILAINRHLYPGFYFAILGKILQGNVSFVELNQKSKNAAQIISTGSCSLLITCISKGRKVFSYCLLSGTLLIGGRKEGANWV